MAPETESRRPDLIRAAAALFSSFGYQGTSMDDIAKSVGLNKGTLYHYVPSKSALLFEIYRDAQERALTHLRAVRADTPADVAIARVIRDQLRSNLDQPAETAVYFQEMRWIHEWLDADQLGIILANEREYVEGVADLVMRGVSDGSFVTSHPHTVAAALVGLIAWTHRWFDASGERTVDEVATVLVRVLLDGIGSGPPGSGPPRAIGEMPTA